MIDWRAILITWVVFLGLKPLVGMRKWRDAIGAALLASVLHVVTPLVTPNENLQTVLYVVVGAVAFAGVWLSQRRQTPSNS